MVSLPNLIQATQPLHYLRRGWTNAELAQHLGITVKTVKTHVSAILVKVGARDRIALIARHPGLPGDDAR